MKDRYNREINYLRISVTDRCNLRCVYCMPAEGITYKQPKDILSFEQIYKIVKASVSLGIEKIRITGGEPLVRKDLPLLIAQLKSIEGLKEICLTTNGVYLGEYARALKKAGVDRINISLDSLIPEKFQRITRGGSLETVLTGIDSALAAGFPSLKINMVLLNNFNTNEILDFAKLTKGKPLEVRFIEYMPTGLHGFCGDGFNVNYSSYEEVFFSAQEVKDICASLGELMPIESDKAATAKTFKIKGFLGSVGFISAISKPFCASCNKLRLTSDGRLRNCLHSAKSIDFKKASDGAEEALSALIKDAVYLKPQSHNLSDFSVKEKGLSLTPVGIDTENFSMCQIGG